MRLPFRVTHLTHTHFLPGGAGLWEDTAVLLKWRGPRSCFLNRYRLRGQLTLAG